MASRLIILCVLLLSACHAQQQTPLVTVDFNTVDWYARRASVAYQSEAEIRKVFPDTVLVSTTRHNEVQYFLERDPVHQRQIITVRGTDNLRNIREDATYIPSRNPKLGIYVHSGFDEDATQIFNLLQPLLDKSQPVVVTGHSLGAAISTLLMMYLQEEGYQVGPSINFGQPKVTNHRGVEKYKSLPLLRIVDENDVAPLVPPRDFLDSLHGPYEHLGREVMLLQGKYYVYEPRHEAETSSVDSFWKNLGDESVSAHFMQHYLQNIALKLNGAEAIPYDQREQYIRD